MTLLHLLGTARIALAGRKHPNQFTLPRHGGCSSRGTAFGEGLKRTVEWNEAQRKLSWRPTPADSPAPARDVHGIYRRPDQTDGA